MNKKNLGKYLILSREGYLAAQDAMNHFYELGYELYGQPERRPMKPGESTDTWFFVMRVQGSGYENVTNLKDVPPVEVDHHLAEGWDIASASISTKFVRMVKRDKQPEQPDTES